MFCLQIDGPVNITRQLVRAAFPERLSTRAPSYPTISIAADSNNKIIWDGFVATVTYSLCTGVLKPGTARDGYIMEQNALGFLWAESESGCNPGTDPERRIPHRCIAKEELKLQSVVGDSGFFKGSI